MLQSEEEEKTNIQKDLVLLTKRHCVAGICHSIVQFKDIDSDHCISLYFGYVQVWKIQIILEQG